MVLWKLFCNNLRKILRPSLVLIMKMIQILSIETFQFHRCSFGKILSERTLQRSKWSKDSLTPSKSNSNLLKYPRSWLMDVAAYGMKVVQGINIFSQK